MTNDSDQNQIKVYDGATHALLQTLSTRGRGGAGGNARGIKHYDGELIAVVNNGSNSVALFRREGDTLTFSGTVSTTSEPVSVDFANGHMYVAGATTVDSFVLHGTSTPLLDGTAWLELAGGGAPAPGSTAQIGVINDRQLLVTLKTPDPGTVDILELEDGRITGSLTAVGAPEGSLTPFGFSVDPDGTALITLAGRAQNGIFRNGAFVSVIDAGQAAPCWATRVGKYVFVANTGGRTISRLVGTGNNLFVDDETAATIATGGGPADIDADAGLLGVVDRGNGQSHLSLFTYNEFGELTAHGQAITIGVPSANGVAILSPRRQGRD
jgi:DNA-binding beta-propeller fold protein YncE